MFGIEKIDLTVSFNPLLFFAGVLLLAGYAVFCYRFTVPAASRSKKVILIFLRSAVLILLLFIIFEPVLTIEKKESYHPVNMIFIDNSRSITIDDGTSRQEAIRSFLAALQESDQADKSILYTFSSSVKEMPVDSMAVKFTGVSTNISEIFNTIEKSSENISSVALVSDGVITEGQNPVLSAAKLNIPVFTLGIGDSTRKNDLILKSVAYNEHIYSGIKTVISGVLLHKGYEGRKASVSLSENGKVLETRTVELTEDGLQNIEFEYTPQTPGEKKITITVSELEGEQSLDNNKKVFFLNILSSKIKVLLIAGAPSADYKFVKNSLKRDENIQLNTITQILPGRYLENTSQDKALDSAQILFLIGYPSSGADIVLWNKISSRILEGKKPFFILVSDATDLVRLGKIQDALPFTINKINYGLTEVLPDIDQSKTRNPLLQSGNENIAADWNSLPPVYLNNSDFSAKPESEVLVNVKIKNVPVIKPLIITRRFGSSNSVAILANEIWRWKLQTAVKNSRLYDNFLFNTLKWLNVKENQKQVIIRTSKKLYSQGEEVIFSAQVYDQAFNPVPDASVLVVVTSEDTRGEVELNSMGNGLYENSFHASKTGDYSFAGNAILEKEILGSDHGTFNIGEVDVEMLDPRMNYEFLSLLSGETGGEFYLPEKQTMLLDQLNKRIERTADYKMVTSELSLWSSEWLLVLVILFFAGEWFIRKQSGML